MRQLRFIFIALITFLFATSAVFLRRTVSVLLCGVLSFNSGSCYSFLDNYGKADAAAPPSSAVVTVKDFSVVQKDKQKIADCIFGVCINQPQIPVSIPGVPSGGQKEPMSPANLAASPARQIDLTGTWSGDGYSCEKGGLVEQVQISINGNYLVAKKITGDNCVPAGNITFQGTLPDSLAEGSSFPVTWTVGIPTNPASSKTVQTLTILNANSFSSYGTKFTRVTRKTQQPWSLKTGVRVSQSIEEHINKIANAYFLATSKNLVITDGLRTAGEQAQAILNKLEKDGEQAVHNLYKNKSLIDEVIVAFKENNSSGNVSQLQAMTDTIQNQIDNNHFISLHLTGRAFDVRSRDMNNTEKSAFSAAVADAGDKLINENSTGEPHYHVQF